MARNNEAFRVAKELDDHGWDGTGYRLPGVAHRQSIVDALDELEQLEKSIDISLGNRDLPIYESKELITDSVISNPVTIIVAETGAGKSTQVPQFLVDAGYRVFITQPRRAAARNVYLRIREEISEVIGEFAGQETISYQTAGELEGPKDARIKVVTDGLQLVRELSSGGMSEIDVLVIDEAHEWNSNIEVLTAWTKKALGQNPNLRVVIMSATMDAHHLAEYYEESGIGKVPVLNIPGRTYEVEKKELPLSTTVAATAEIVAEMTEEIKAREEAGEDPDPNNGILVFMPGKREINEKIQAIRRMLPKDSNVQVKIYPLHAKMSKERQQAAIIPETDCIKIVLATDVAQTSLTISYIKWVVDSGLQRHINSDGEGVHGLELIPISQADCDQRAGRCGRVSDGRYRLTRLDVNTPHIPYESRDQFPTPEIIRTDIARNMLRLKALDLDIAEFDIYHPISSHMIEIAEINLKLLGALDENGDMTQMGAEMNEYPLCTSSARIMVESLRFKESTRACLAAIVAAKEVGGLQYYDEDVGARWKSLTDETSSDMLVQLDLFIAAQNMTDKELIQHDLDVENVKRVHEQFRKVSRLAGARYMKLDSPSERVREDIKDCIAAGYITSIYSHEGNGEYVHAFNGWPTRRRLSNRSQVAGASPLILGDPYRIGGGADRKNPAKDFVENVTPITASRLGQVAATYVELHIQDYFMDPHDGKFKQRNRPKLFGIDLGVTVEQIVEPSARVRQEIINYAIANPGNAQNELRAIKTELEKLAHRSKSHVAVLTHDRIVELIHEAAPANITNPSEIEDNLRKMLTDPNMKLALDDFVSPEVRERIKQNSPDTIEVSGVHIHISYNKGNPVARAYNSTLIHQLSEELYLEDGRQIMFSARGTKKKFTLFELQAKLRN